MTTHANLSEPLPAHVMQCVRMASAEYAIPQLVYLGVLKTEGGWSGLKKKNVGVGEAYRWDYGIAQVNSSNVSMISRQLGLEYHQVEYSTKNNDCYNIMVGAFLLKKAILASGGDLWRGVGAYHTGANITKKSQVIRSFNYQKMVYQKMVYMKENNQWW